MLKNSRKQQFYSRIVAFVKGFVILQRYRIAYLNGRYCKIVIVLKIDFFGGRQMVSIYFWVPLNQKPIKR
jgi:hypothetical protein